MSLCKKVLATATLAAATSLSATGAHAVAFDLEALLGNAAEFTLLGLEQGDVIINSATSITGDVGYSAGVTSGTNQKVDEFIGTAWQHTTASVTTTPATFAPTGGTRTGPNIDSFLDQANTDARAASSFLSSVNANNVGAGVTFAEVNLGALGDNNSRGIDSTGGTQANIQVGNVDFTRVNIDSLNYKSDRIRLFGDATDVFLLNVSGDFNFAGSFIELNGVSDENVIFNFANASNISIYKAESQFNGRILAPEASVLYHNPATFNGAILAKNINVHSDFNISGPSVTSFNPGSSVTAPAPAGLGLMALCGMGLMMRRRKISG